jgi:tetratricopeptide (TPR) repeat protein
LIQKNNGDIAQMREQAILLKKSAQESERELLESQRTIAQLQEQMVQAKNNATEVEKKNLVDSEIIVRLQVQLKQAKAYSDELEQKLKIALDDRERSVRETKNVHDLDVKLTASKATIAQLQGHVKRLELYSEDLAQKLKILDKSREQSGLIKRNVQELETKLASSNAMVAQMQAQIKQSKADFGALEQKTKEAGDQLQQKLARSQEDYRDLEKRFQASRQWMRQVQEAQVRDPALKKLAAAESRKQRLQESLAQAKASREDLVKRLETCETQARHDRLIVQELESLRKDLMSEQCVTAGLKDQLSLTQRNSGELVRKNKELLEQAQRGQECVKSAAGYEIAFQAMRSEIAQVKSQCQAEQKNRDDLSAQLLGEKQDLYLELGAAYIKANLNQAAFNAYEKVLQINPNNAQAHYVLGLLYKQSQNDKQNALVHLKQYLQIDPRAQNRTDVEYLIKMIESE